MTLREITLDIKILLTKVLQEYLEITCREKFGENYMDIIVNEIRLGIQGDFQTNYNGAYEKMLLKGISDYSIKDMDISIIITLLKYSDALRCCGFKGIRKILDSFTFDRNFDSHLSTNETEIELYQWSIMSLANLKIFLTSVIKYLNIPQAVKEKFIVKFSTETEQLSKLVEKEFMNVKIDEANEALMLKEINYILNNKDPFGAWVMIEGKYLQMWGVADGHVRWVDFLKCASKHNIIWAKSSLAKFYQDGVIVEQNYNEAAKLYSEAYDVLLLQDKIEFAYILENNLCSILPKENYTELFNELNSHSSVTKIVKDNVIYYSRKRRCQ